MQPVISEKHIEKSMSYLAYREMIDMLLAEDKTTGLVQSPRLIAFTRLNVQRMRRLDKTTILNTDLVNKLERVPEKWIWLVLTEAWCGDAAQLLPVLEKMAAISPNIALRFLLRDENLEVMDAYLTNGGRAVPKLISLRAHNLEEVGTWGPRPALAQQMMMDYKANPVIFYEQLGEDLQRWYTKDKSLTFQEEFSYLLDEWIIKSR
jgi:hypothetical protein